MSPEPRGISSVRLRVISSIAVIDLIFDTVDISIGVGDTGQGGGSFCAMITSGFLELESLDLKRLADRLGVELHFDAATLSTAIDEAIQTAFDLRLDGRRLKWWLADHLEDCLGANGDGIHQHLDEAASRDWRGICGRAFDKALTTILDRENPA